MPCPKLIDSVAFHAGTTTTELEEQWNQPILGNLFKGFHNVFVKDPAQGAYGCFYAALHKDVAEKGWNGAYFTDEVSLTASLRSARSPPPAFPQLPCLCILVHPHTRPQTRPCSDLPAWPLRAEYLQTAKLTRQAVQGGESPQAKDLTLCHAAWELSQRMIEGVLGAGSMGQWQ